MKRTLSLLLALVLLLSLPAAGFAITDSERYADTLSRLQDYLSTGKSLSHEERITVLDSLFMNFFEQYGYEMGAQFSSYVDILRMIENCDFGQTYVKIEKLRKSLTFDALLQQDPGAYGTLRQLEAYMLARKAENEGDKETALQYYYNCGDYFDSYLRSNSLADTRYKTMYSEAKQCILDGNFERAYILLQELATIHYEQSDNLLLAVKDSLGISAAVAETPPQPEPAAEPNPPAEVVPESFTLRRIRERRISASSGSIPRPALRCTERAATLTHMNASVKQATPPISITMRHLTAATAITLPRRTTQRSPTR